MEVIRRNCTAKDSINHEPKPKDDKQRNGTMKTPEPLTIERLYELCELAKTSPKGYPVEVKREELWALVEMAKRAYTEAK